MSISKYLLIAALALGSVTSTFAQTADDMAAEGDQLVKNLKEEDAYAKYKSALVVQPDNLHALVQCSFMASRIGGRQTDKGKATTFYTEAQDLAGRALKVDSTNADAHVALAIADFRLTPGLSAKKRAEYGRDVKNLCDKAIKLDPRNYRAWYLLGLWNIMAFHMSGAERAEAKVLYGGIPDATIKTAIACFEKCRSINPSYIINYLDLAKVYKEDDQTEKAITALETLVKLPVQTEDDPATKAEGRKMLDSLM